MLSRSLRPLVAATVSLALGACSSIGSINGVQLAGAMGATKKSASEQSYCEQNDEQRLTCILLGAAAIGGGVALIHSRRKSSNAPAAAPPPPPPPPGGDT
jgi:hypothetical protein